jgi:hypothetical protein
MAATNTKREYGSREARSERVTARVTASTREALEQRAISDDRDVSDVVRLALEAYLTPPKKTRARR